MVSRRSACQAVIAPAALAAVAAWPAAARAARGAQATTARMATAWDDAQGRHHVGVLERHDGASPRWAPRHALEVPTRAHAVLPCADGSLVAVARRPGAWMLRWFPGRAAATAQWRWSEPDRSFNGHVVAESAQALLCTETDQGSGAGLLVRRDARSLAVRDEWPTAGIDPHAVLALPGGDWLVANGGVPTRAESGRARLDMAAMDSSLVRLDAQGRLLGQWRLADRHLSLRHLALHTGGSVGVALQAEHADLQARERAPLLALWDGQALRAGDAVPLQGYAGDILAWPGGFLLGATRAGCVARFDLAGRLIAQHPLPDACALASTGPGGAAGAHWLAAGRGGALRQSDQTTLADDIANGLRIDNHWRPWPA